MLEKFHYIAPKVVAALAVFYGLLRFITYFTLGGAGLFADNPVFILVIAPYLLLPIAAIGVFLEKRWGLYLFSFMALVCFVFIFLPLVFGFHGSTLEFIQYVFLRLEALFIVSAIYFWFIRRKFA